jgi:hypothetical protein
MVVTSEDWSEKELIVHFRYNSFEYFCNRFGLIVDLIFFIYNTIRREILIYPYF